MDGGDIPDKQLKLLPRAVKDASEFLLHHPDTRARFDRVADLVEGFESPFGMELLSTVHWVIRGDSVHSVDEAVRRVHAWNNRKFGLLPAKLAFLSIYYQTRAGEQVEPDCGGYIIS